MNKYNINIQYSHDNFYKVTLTDNHGARTVVYEQSVDAAFDYALQWCRESDQRKEERDTHAKAIAECIKLDKEAGITSGNRDCLD